MRWILAVLLIGFMPGLLPDGAAAESSRRNPIPFGTPEIIGDWAIRISRVVFDGADEVLAENQFNDPPQPGHRFVIAWIEGAYLGSEIGDLFWDISLKLVGRSSVVYTQSDPGCGVVPEDMMNLPEVFPGGMISGNACWSVPEFDIDSVVLFAEPAFSLGNDREFFALSERGRSRTGTIEAGPGRPASEAQIIAARNSVRSDTRAGGKENPIPLGQPARIGNWRLRVVRVDTNATDLVLSENLFNEPPEPGYQFVMARIKATLVEPNDDPEAFWSDISLKVVGDSAVAFGQSNPGCGVVPDDLSGAPDVFVGGAISANACWSVPATDIDSIIMFAQPVFDVRGSEPIFFALR